MMETCTVCAPKSARRGLILCRPMSLPAHVAEEAAKTAVAQNPCNQPAHSALPPEHIALLTSRYWGAKGVHLTVQFLDTAEAALKVRILSHMNAWGQFANVVFVETAGEGQVRITRGASGYWSYLGTDILHVDLSKPTMNLEGFSMSTPESEYHRVVRHETGHTLGFPHEHLRKELVQRIDPQKAIAYFAQQDGWSADMVTQQVLTPLDDSTLTETATADQLSIMCYQLPGSITKDGQPIIGGTDIDATDGAFAAKIYPKAGTPPTPPVKPTGGVSFEFTLSRQVPDGGSLKLQGLPAMAPGKYGVSAES